MLVFYNAGEWNRDISIVYYSIPLIVGHVQNFLFKADCPIIEFAEAKAVEFVYRAREHNLLGQTLPIWPIYEKIRVRPGFNAIKQTVDQPIESAFRNALIFVVKIVVVVNQADWQTPDDKSRKVGAFASPLFLGITPRLQ